MEIEFLKLMGCGSDLLLVDCRKQPSVQAASVGVLASKILDRRNGVGADLLVLLSLTPEGGPALRTWDPRGEETDPSSGALACAARYGFDAGFARREGFPLEQRSGTVQARIIDSVHSRLTLGPPLAPDTLETIREIPNAPSPRTITLEGKLLPYVAVRFGQSYGVFFTSDLAFHGSAMASKIAAQDDFPPETQIGFVRIDSREALRLKAWQRCGAPDRGRHAAAAVVAAVLQGFSDREVFVHVLRSRLFVQWTEESNVVHLTVPATYIFTGTYDYVEEKQQSD